MTAFLEPIDDTALFTTTNDSQQTAYSWVPAVNSSGIVYAQVMVRRASDGASKAMSIEVGYRRGSGNAAVYSSTLQQFGSTADLNALSNVAALFDVVGNTCVLRIEGQDAVELDWAMRFRGGCVYRE
jgi:hypothetical protein